MKTVDTPHAFTRLSDGTVLLRQPNGTYHPVGSNTDHDALAKISDEQIEHWSQNDPDHLGLDDTFWDHLELALPTKEAISIKLDSDILKWFRRDGRGYQTRINLVLRHFVQSSQVATETMRKTQRDD